MIIGSAVNDRRRLYDPVHKRAAAREWQGAGITLTPAEIRSLSTNAFRQGVSTGSWRAVIGVGDGS